VARSALDPACGRARVYLGSGLTIRPLLTGGLSLRTAIRTALAADTISIGVKEVTDNAIVLAIPGAWPQV
jgi:hypothetical protein